MTWAARNVLMDCRIALQLLEEETNLQRWRVHWAGAVALTRAVGHVLDKVDGRSPVIRTAAKEAYARWKGQSAEHEIFREFIEKERNNILKEYKFSHDQADDVHVVIVGTLMNTNNGTLSKMEKIIPISDNIYRPIIEGYREGDDARDVLSDALNWWENELAAIDQKARATSSPIKTEKGS